MPHDLDHLLARLAEAETPAPAGFDRGVLAAIAVQREDARRARTLAPVGLAAVGMAVAVGVAAGGLGAAAAVAQPRQLSAFSAHAHLAPSTLLDGAE
jgi:hypothetical protein